MRLWPWVLRVHLPLPMALQLSVLGAQSCHCFPSLSPRFNPSCHSIFLMPWTSLATMCETRAQQAGICDLYSVHPVKLKGPQYRCAAASTTGFIPSRLQDCSLPITSPILHSSLEISALSSHLYAKTEVVEDPVPLSQAGMSVPARPESDLPADTWRVGTSCNLRLYADQRKESRIDFF